MLSGEIRAGIRQVEIADCFLLALCPVVEINLLNFFWFSIIIKSENFEARLICLNSEIF